MLVNPLNESVHCKEHSGMCSHGSFLSRQNKRVVFKFLKAVFCVPQDAQILGGEITITEDMDRVNRNDHGRQTHQVLKVRRSNPDDLMVIVMSLFWFCYIAAD